MKINLPFKNKRVPKNACPAGASRQAVSGRKGDENISEKAGLLPSGNQAWLAGSPNLVG
jgi:hypothetical protein